MLVVLFSNPVAAEVGEPHKLIRAPRSVAGGVVPPQSAAVRRSRLVEIDPGPLKTLPVRAGRSAVSIGLLLDLFDGEVFTAELTTTTREPGRSVVFEGSIEGEPESSIVLALAGEEMFGNIKLRDRWYQIRSATDGLHALVEMDDALLGDILEPVVGTSQPMNVEAAAVDNGSMIDLLVVYTPRMRDAAGGPAGAQNLIATAIAETNSAYQKSGVTQRVRVVHTAETANWNESGRTVNADTGGFSFNAVLGYLTDTDDGRMDQVHALRDTHGADAVVLLVDIGGSCGIAWVNAGASNAFSVVQWTCATGNYSFGHELGHNMGLNHERGTTGADYNYGWADPTGAFRTIMATGCGNYSCGRIQQFSNPEVLYGGRPTGAPLGSPSPAYAARTLNEGAVRFSQFRPSATPSCTFTLNATSVSVGALASAGTVSITTGSTCNWSATSRSSFLTVTSGSSGTGNGTVTYAVAANSGASRSGTIEIAGHNFTVNQSAGAPLTAPTNVRADSLGATVRISWQAVANATSYTVQRRAAGGVIFEHTTSSLSWDDAPGSNAAYLYQVRANAAGAASPYSPADLATTVAFSDDPLSTGIIKAAHLAELRTAVNRVRSLAGLATLPFTDAAVPGTRVRSVHVTELRGALDAALTRLALPVTTYRNSAIAGQLVRAADFQELRVRVR